MSLREVRAWARPDSSKSAQPWPMACHSESGWVQLNQVGPAMNWGLYLMRSSRATHLLPTGDALSDLHASPEFLFWLLQDVESIIEESALVSPLLICLDDLHWAGLPVPSPCDNYHQRLASLPVAWVMTFRPDQGLHQIQEAKLRLLNSGADLIHLGPVGREAVAEIAADVLGVWPDDELLHKAERVQGNPFLLMEFLRGLQDDRLISVKSGRASLVSDRLPHRLNVSMRRRLAAMSPTCEQVATVACGLGRRFTLHELVAMTEISISDLMSPVQRPPTNKYLCRRGQLSRVRSRPHSRGGPGKHSRPGPPGTGSASS